MNDEQRMEQQLRDFYIADERPHDRHALLRDVMDSVHATPQRRKRRWWPFGRHAALTSQLPSRELEPELATVTMNGHAGTSGKHGPGRLGGVAVAMAAVILALFSGFVVFNLLGSDDPALVPAASDSPSQSPSASLAPTEEPSGEPPATPGATDAETAAAPSEGLLEAEPGFDSEFVETGIERITSDGAGFDIAALPEDVHYAFADIAIGGGDIWVVAYRYHSSTGRTDGPLAWELGSGLETSPAQGLPRDHQKLLIENDGTPIVIADDGVRAFDGERWVSDPGTRRITGDESTTWIVEQADLASIGGGDVDGSNMPAGVLVLRSDRAGYATGHELGRRYVKEWPTTWFSCDGEAVDYGEGNGCNDRAVADDRGLGASHNDGSSALLLADTTTGRLDRHDDSSIWVLTGPSIDDFWAGRADESGAIYRIDATAPGFLCQGCY